MREIKKEDISGLNDIVMELPAFRDLKSSEMMHELLDTFMEDIYIKQPQELFDVMQFNPNSKMQETFFFNYGIDKKYSSRLKGYLKKDISYQLEKLFQNKGSRKIFEIFANIFENIFRKINFYNVKVYKIPAQNGFIFEYQLDPIYITDPDNVILYPQVQINKTRKYLMELQNFKDYTAWPMPTNLIYIQLSIGEEVINNMHTFLDGIRSYGTTYLQGKFFQYKSKRGYFEHIHGADIEYIIKYFQLKIVKSRNPDFELNDICIMGSDLPFDPELTPGDPSHPNFQEYLKWSGTREDFLKNMQILLNDYETAKRNSRKEIENLRRRWQIFLNFKQKSKECYDTLDDFFMEFEEKYQFLAEDFQYCLSVFEEDTEPIFDFYVYIYSIFLSGVFANPEDPSLGYREDWVIDYIDVLFGNLFIEADFLKWYFDPVMDLFIRYFFPIEMEYINDLIPKILIRDKWNTISYDDNTNFVVMANHWDPQTPIRGIDWQKFSLNMTDRYSYLDTRSMSKSFITHPLITTMEPADDRYTAMAIKVPHDKLKHDDNYKTIKFNTINNMKSFSQKASVCFSFNRTKEYVLRVLKQLDSVVNHNIKENHGKKGLNF